MLWDVKTLKIVILRVLQTSSTTCGAVEHFSTSGFLNGLNVCTVQAEYVILSVGGAGCKTEPLHQHNRIMTLQWGVNNADVVKKGFYKYFMMPEMTLNMFVRPSG